MTFTKHQKQPYQGLV